MPRREALSTTATPAWGKREVTWVVTSKQSKDAATVLVLLLIGLESLSGCLAVPRVETMVHENQRAMVALKTFPDPSFKANHPATIEPLILSQVLQGITVHEQKTLLESVLTGDGNPIHAFSPEEITILTPWLVDAFNQATSEEEVVFQLTQGTSDKKTQTAGSLYLSGNVLYLTLSQFHLSSAHPSLLTTPSRSFFEPKSWRIEFEPQTALVIGTQNHPGTINTSTPPTLAIRLDSLSRDGTLGSDAAIQRNRFPVPDSLSSGHDRPNFNSQTEQTHQTQEPLRGELQQLRKTIQEQNQRLKRLEEQINHQDKETRIPQ